jgi:hypothetical protein
MDKTTLTYAEQLAKEATELNAFNSINLLGIKESLTKMLGQIGKNGLFDEYTKHDINHVDIMLGLINDIVPEQTKKIMTKADWLLIVLSTYFHDLGMLVSKNEYANRNKNQLFKDFKEAYENKPSNKESLKTLSQEQSERFVYQEFVRKNHGKRIADWLNAENTELYDGEIVKLVRNMVSGLKPLFVKDIAVICESHNEDDLDNNDKYPVKHDYGMNIDEKGNVFYAALILRTADMLHITGDRAPSIEYQIISPSNPTSQIEWAKQASVTSISPKEQIDGEGNVDKSKQSDTFTITGYFEDPKGFFPLMDYLDYARKQLQASYRLNEEKKKKFSMEYEFPWKDIDDGKIETKDYERRQLSFTIDQQKILDLLVGETLYNNITVSLREIAQNAIDAVKVKKFEYEQDKEGLNKSYVPKVDVKWIPETRQLIVADNGTGMDMNIIQNHLLKVGSSRYSDKDFIKTHSGYHSISRFGIGLLSCFLVAEDVDILTRTKAKDKPLLLKVSKLHGKYLLKHGVEDNSPLSFLDNSQSGTSIMLKIKSEIGDFEPEKILREWILFPACSFTYTENNDSKDIGYKDTKALLEYVLQSKGLDKTEYKIVGQNESGIDMSILLKKNMILKEWSFVEYFDIIRNENFDVFPCGISIEGIRIDKNTPGFEQPYFIAIANLIGKEAQARPNVARSAIDSKTIGGVMGRVYDLYLKEIKRQMMDISQEYSITWASSELPFLLDVFTENSHHISHTILNKDEFNKSIEKQQYHLLYKDDYSFKSIEELKDIGHFWMIDSAAYNSATNLIREAKKSNLSAMDLLKVLYGDDCGLFNDVDVVLNNRLLRCDLDRQIIEKFEITDVRIFDEYRSLNLKWEVKDEETPRWLHCYASYGNYYGQVYSLFVQNSEINIININNYEAFRCEYGLFVLSGNAIYNYIKDLNNKLSINNEFDSRILDVVCSFIYRHYGVSHADEDWAHLFEEHISRYYSGSFYQQIKSKINIDSLINACELSSFSVYDKYLWYRRKDD